MFIITTSRHYWHSISALCINMIADVIPLKRFEKIIKYLKTGPTLSLNLPSQIRSLANSEFI